MASATNSALGKRSADGDSERPEKKAKLRGGKIYIKGVRWPYWSLLALWNAQPVMVSLRSSDLVRFSATLRILGPSFHELVQRTYTLPHKREPQVGFSLSMRGCFC